MSALAARMIDDDAVLIAKVRSRRRQSLPRCPHNCKQSFFLWPSPPPTIQLTLGLDFLTSNADLLLNHRSGRRHHQVFDPSEYSTGAASSNPASPGPITSFLPSLGLLSIKEVSPFNQSLEDNEYAYYKNLLEDKDTPEMKKFITQVLSSCTPLLLEHFVNSIDEIKLDDVFCISYNSSQHDSRCAKHQVRDCAQISATSTTT